MNNKFYKFADLPPNPFDEEDLKDYKEMGANICLLTEDDVKLIKDGKLNDDYIKAINNISDKGLEVWIRNMYNDEEYFQCTYEKNGENYGTPYKLKPRNITDEFLKYKSVTGFYMADEAYMYTLPEKSQIGFMQDIQKKKHPEKYTSFDKLTKLVDWKNKYYPDSFFHMNHVPAQSWDHYIPKNGEIYDYEDFLEEYCNVILKRLKGCKRSLCLDNYPLVGKNYIEQDYLEDLLTLAKVWRKYNSEVDESEKAVMGICIQTFCVKSMFDERRRDIILPEEVSFQIYMGMAIGARLFEYFAYRSYEHEMIGIKAPGGQKRIYDIVKEGIRRTEQFEEILSHYDGRGVFVSPGYIRTENTHSFIKAKRLLKNDGNISVQSEYDTVVGCFENEKSKGYMIVNYTDPILKHISKVAVRFDNASEAEIYLNGDVNTVKLKDGSIDIILENGNAAFVIPK